MIKDSKAIVNETEELFRQFCDNPRRQEWATQFQEDREFRLGKQWTFKQKQELEARGQAPIVVNRIHPAVETAKSLLTYQRPSFRTSPREDSDNKTAQAFGALIEYVWYISDGNMEVRQVVDDYYVGGMGAMLVYQDPIADNGYGEVKTMSLDPLDLYFDPTGRSRFGDDFSDIIYSRLYTPAQAKKWKPLFDSKIDKAQSDQDTERPTTNRADDGETSWPEEPEIMDQTIQEFIRGYERYTMVASERYRIFESFSTQEKILKKEEFQGYLKTEAWIIDGQVFTEEKEAIQYAEAIRQESMKQGQRVVPEIQNVDYAYLLKMEMIKVVKVTMRTIRQICVMGDQLLYVRDLPDTLQYYPIVLFQNLHTGTPFPTSDVRLVRHLQEYINKIRSLIVAHAASSTNLKVLLPKGSVDRSEFEREWARAGGVGIEVDYDFGEPKVVAPVALPNELYANEQTAKADIDHQFGLYEMMMGNSAAAPDTYKATVALDEYGQRKIKGKLMDIEAGLTRLGKVMIPFIQQLYTKEKIIRLVQPNNSMTEYAINKRMYDDKGDVIEILNDVSRGQYDVVVVAGSTLPTNRYAQLEIYMEAYRMGLIDQQEVLKKTEIFDIEGVLQRSDMIAKLQGQLEQAMQVIKQQKGDLQTREREVYHSNQSNKLAKFESRLDQITNKAEAAATLFDARLQDDQKERKAESSKKEK